MKKNQPTVDEIARKIDPTGMIGRDLDHFDCICGIVIAHLLQEYALCIIPVEKQGCAGVSCQGGEDDLLPRGKEKGLRENIPGKARMAAAPEELA